MKKKRLIGLILTVALLCVAMIVQLVSAKSDEQYLNPAAQVVNLNDYYIKTEKTSLSMQYLDGNGIPYLSSFADQLVTFNYSFYGDGRIGGKKTTTTIQDGMGSTTSSSFTMKKEFDDQNRLVSFENTDSEMKEYSVNYLNDESYILTQMLSGKEYTYDPEHKTYYEGGFTIEYDSDGQKNKLIQKDANGNVIQTIYITYYYDLISKEITSKDYRIENSSGTVTESGTVDIEYTGNGSIHHETIPSDRSTVTYDRYFDNNDRLIKTVAKEITSSNITAQEITTTYSYDRIGNLTSHKQTINQGNAFIVNASSEYTYEYHSLYEKNAEAIPEEEEKMSIEEYWALYSQNAVNNGGDIAVQMTEPDSSNIKTAGIQTYDDGSEYYFNVITKPLDATEDQVFTLNLTGSDVDSVDEEDPTPAHSFNIYDSNIFSEDHLVANIENGKMENAAATSLEENAVVEQANAGGSGTLMMALPLQVKAAEASGYNVSVTIPANTLEEGKTYYFVLDKKMVVNEATSATTNTDFVYKFKTAGDGVHEHTYKTLPGKDATCTEPGLTDGKVCEECGEILISQKEIPAKGHNEEVLPAKAATCTETGLTEGKKCSVCGEVLEAQEEIPALGHKETAPVRENEVAATCTKEGSYDEVVYCSECNEELSRETKTVDKLPHTEEVIKGKAATCTEKGLTDGKKCSVCGEVLKAQEEIPALGHDYKDGVCTRCGDKDPNYQPEVPDEPEEPATSPKLPFFVNGIVKGLDGKWAMYKKGEVDTSYTGIAHNLFGWWRVKDGYVDFDANGIYKNEFGWWKTTKGKVTFKETGVFKNEYGWWRVVNSKVDFKASGIYKNKYGWWKTTNGKVTFDETGVFKNQFGWWYVKDSKVDFNFTGIASNQYGTWYIKNGKVDFTKNGKVDFDGKTYQVTFGKAKLA